MRLLDLNPRRVQGGGITLDCPRCREVRIWAGPGWEFHGEFADMTVKPSLNANPDHAHFEIERGQIIMSNECRATCASL